MVVVFGWGAGEAQDLGEVAPVVCPKCHNHVYLHEIRSEKRVSLYFVPLVPYGSNEYLACPICRAGLEIGPEHKAAVDGMRMSTAMYRKGSSSDAMYRASVERFWRSMGVAPSGEQVVHPPPDITGPAAGAVDASAAPSMSDRLRALASLHGDGVLTDDEFAAAKKRLLEA